MSASDSTSIYINDPSQNCGDTQPQTSYYFVYDKPIGALPLRRCLFSHSLVHAGTEDLQFLCKPDLHGMTECRMAEWRDGGMAEWQNGGRNGGMAEWQCTVKTNIRTVKSTNECCEE